MSKVGQLDFQKRGILRKSDESLNFQKYYSLEEENVEVYAYSHDDGNFLMIQFPNSRASIEDQSRFKIVSIY